MPWLLFFFSANLLYVYNTSWKLDSVPLLVGNVQAKVTSAGDPKLTKKCLSQIRTWCNFVELGHLVPKQGSPLIDPKKYLQLLLGLMAKIDLTLGPVKLNTTVRTKTFLTFLALRLLYWLLSQLIFSP